MADPVLVLSAIQPQINVPLYNLLLYLLYYAILPMRNINALEYARHWHETKKITFQITESVNLKLKNMYKDFLFKCY